MNREQDVLAARAAADQWAAERGLPASGGYSGTWYVTAYLAGWWPDAWLRWWAYYNNDPGSILSVATDTVGHQFTSTPVDQDAFMDSEILQYGPVADPPPDCQVCKDALDRGVQRLWIEVAKKTTLSKKLIKEIADEMFQALQSMS